MNRHFDPAVTATPATFIDMLCRKEFLTSGELRIYVAERCPFISRMFRDNGTYSFNTWANQYFKKIPGCTSRQDVPYRVNKIWFYNREIIDNMERAFAMTSLRLLKTGQKEAIPDHIDRRYYFSEFAQKIQASWAVEITLEHLGHQAA